MTVQVIDTLLMPDYEKIRQDVSNVMDSPIWRYGWHSTQEKPDRFWNRQFLGNKKDTIPSGDEFHQFKFIWPEISKLWQCIDNCLSMHNLVLTRAYANAYTYGTGGAIHIDDGQYTVLYYASPKWERDWNGETLFFPEDATPLTVEYIPGRIVFFNAKIPHQGREVSRFCTELRTIVAFKCFSQGASND